MFLLIALFELMPAVAHFLFEYGYSGSLFYFKFINNSILSIGTFDLERSWFHIKNQSTHIIIIIFLV